jgi:hypothetical protein
MKKMVSYRKKYTHVLSGVTKNKNLAAKANGKTGFKGFRKVRKFIPEIGMSKWVYANWYAGA